MRNEDEMMKLIIDTAKEDERIRAVYMNGSRTNVNAPKDKFQDYDIVYIVTETRPFYEDEHWHERFGEILYMQCPEASDASRGMECNFDACYGWLMQFTDGNRLDLHVETLESCDILDDKLCRILLDKDGALPEIPESSDEDHWVQRPDEAEYLAVCNEFWWCLNNIAKGLWRDEIPYAQDMLNMIVRPQLVKVMSWRAGILNGFKISVGKSGKYLHRWIDEDSWERFLSTYCGGIVGEIWRSVFIMCDLFDEIAEYVGNNLGFKYNRLEAANSRSYLENVKVQSLSKTENDNKMNEI